MEAQERAVFEHATALLEEIEGVRILGPESAAGKVGVVSFVMDSAHPHDIGTILDTEGIAIRAGHHCTQPLMDQYGIPGTVRASLAFYNNTNDIDRLVEGVKTAVKMLK